ncbi:cytochrome P450 family protein [Rhizoctonia solani]|uniref:Cytochrome P450 family protein n=1 Tax=Rhizoctonia solani TaxID=456999 RepID=A0A8H8SZV2_9AGAM|nr:cytochrome P450 family protein [Rhizoctonia solani]QRW23829.1 cytochrome P450 family protein [Rhizoctonia solani]
MEQLLKSAYITLLVFGLVFLYALRHGRGRKLKHPPSPSSLPFVGNIFSMPSGPEYIAYMKLGHQLNSDIIYLKLLGHSTIILNSAQAASDLFEKRSSKYSDRINSPMATDPTLLDWPGHPSFIGYNDLWRSYRRLIGHWFNAHAVTQFHQSHEQQAHLLLRRLLAISKQETPFEGTQRTAREWREQKNRALNSTFQWTKGQVATGLAKPSVVGTLLDHHLTSKWAEEDREYRLKELGILLFSGGTETSGHALLGFVATMVLNPKIQARAQKEIDDVIGNLKLPKVEDQARLPYVRNLIMETLRWHPVLPTALPHVCYEDDVYRGYDIPKGTVLIGNLWAMSRDETLYKDSDTFNPDRFLDPNVPPFPAFGWGRRKCPGLYYGQDTVFVAVASLLATFTFKRKLDSNGQEIVPKIEHGSNSLTLGLEPFEFELAPRSEKHEQLILDLSSNLESGRN